MFDDPRKTITLISIIIVVIATTIGGYLGHLLKKYFFGKDYKKAETPLNQIFSKKLNILIFAVIPIFIAILYVILYQRLPEKMFIDFIIYGFASAISNLIFMFIIFYFFKEEFLTQLGGNYMIAIVYFITLIIPFFIYFVLVSLVFSGWQVPFEF